MTDLDRIRRDLVACRDIPWSCSCVESEQLAALVEEVERLRAFVADCEQSYRFAASKAETRERQAVVSLLRTYAAWEPVSDLFVTAADVIERGEHRKGEP